jgi:hypothetical protein
MPAVAGESVPVGKVSIFRPSSAARFCVGVSRGAPGESTAKCGRRFAAATAHLILILRAVQEENVGALINIHFDPGGRFLNPGVGRRSVGLGYKS